ncbi:MAG: ribonuclease catalytic domain-containing protein [Burkholderiales bacterium]
MTNVFYEEDGELKVATVLADNETSLQVEAPHGKRSKIKSNAVLMRFTQPSAAELLHSAQHLADEIDVEFLWECCAPDAEIGFEDLTREYVGHTPLSAEQAAVLIKLHSAPMYFYKKGRGRYRPAPEANLRAALAGLEKKRQQEAQKQQAIKEMQAGQMPDWLRGDLATLLYRPDKNTLAYKTLEAAGAVMHLTIPQMLEHCGALRDSRSWHEGKFHFEYFGPLSSDAVYPLTTDHSRWPLSEVQAFSIDDAFTTEIDDAFSVSEQDADHWRVGIHIAAPGLGFAVDSELDQVARQRLSTVYMPGDKIPMLPDSVIRAHTLEEGRANPALSLKLTVRKSDFEVVARASCIERVTVVRNLRIHDLETQFDPEAVTGPHPFHAQLRVLWQLAQRLAVLRGVKERPVQHYLDFNFVVEGDRVAITQRPRGSPLDTLVAELMIEVNAVWGKLLADADVPGLFRTQVSGKTSLSVKPAPHQGLGVAQYAWSSSPLRRYVDLINQWQLISLLSGEVPVFVQQDNTLSGIARQFELAYDVYNEFQRSMERYWSLRWLQQENIEEREALMLREGLARLAGLPLVVKVHGAAEALPGTNVRVSVERINLWDMTLVCHLKAILEPLVGISET